MADLAERIEGAIRATRKPAKEGTIQRMRRYAEAAAVVAQEAQDAAYEAGYQAGHAKALDGGTGNPFSNWAEHWSGHA
jgi:hypothetical protein